MLQRLTLTNFQSHEDAALELDPGLNIIIGSSDSGKSSIIRALEWAVYNRPNGHAFMRNGSKRCEVRLDFDDGWVNRYRTKSINGCDVNGTPLSAFGVGVIPEVEQVTRMTEVNLQSQMDSPFLLSCTPPEIARKLNEVADLQDIDLAIKNINAMHRADVQAVAVAEGLVNTTTASLKQYDELDVLVELWEDYEKRDAKCKKLSRQIGVMNLSLTSHELYRTSARTIPEFDTDELNEMADELEQLDTEIVQAESEIEMTWAFAETVEDCDKLIAQCAKDYKKLKPSTCPTCGGKWK